MESNPRNHIPRMLNGMKNMAQAQFKDRVW